MSEKKGTFSSQKGIFSLCPLPFNGVTARKINFWIISKHWDTRNIPLKLLLDTIFLRASYYFESLVLNAFFIFACWLFLIHHSFLLFNLHVSYFRDYPRNRKICEKKMHAKMSCPIFATFSKAEKGTCH